MMEESPIYVLQGTWRDSPCVVICRSDGKIYSSNPEVSGILHTAPSFETYFDRDPLPSRQVALDPSKMLHIIVFLDSLVYWETVSVEPMDTFPAPPSPAQEDAPGLVY